MSRLRDHLSMSRRTLLQALRLGAGSLAAGLTPAFPSGVLPQTGELYEASAAAQCACVSLLPAPLSRRTPLRVRVRLGWLFAWPVCDAEEVHSEQSQCYSSCMLKADPARSLSQPALDLRKIQVCLLLPGIPADASSANAPTY